MPRCRSPTTGPCAIGREIAEGREPRLHRARTGPRRRCTRKRKAPYRRTSPSGVLACCVGVVAVRSERPYGQLTAMGRIVGRAGLHPFTIIMKNDPITQMLWSSKDVLVERQVTFEPNAFALSHRVHEVTMLAADVAPRRAVKPYADLELGAHVVMMRALAETPDVTPHVRSWRPLPTPRALPVVWEPV